MELREKSLELGSSCKVYELEADLVRSGGIISQE